MAVYTLKPGSFNIKPDKSAYQPGETVTINVAYDISKSGWTGGAWSINAEVYDLSAKLLDRDGETNFETTTRSVSTLASPRIHPRFKMGSASMVIMVVLDADGVKLGNIYKTIPLGVAPPEPPPEPTEKFILQPGSFQVKAGSPPYSAGEVVKLAVAYDVSKKGLVGGTWSINAEVYAGGLLLDVDGRNYWEWESRAISSLHDPKVHPQFKMSSIEMAITVKLLAVYNPTIYPPATEVPLGEVSLTIPYAEEPEPPGAFVLLPGSFQVKPDKSSYQTGQTVRLNVGYDVTRTGIGLGWSVNASVFDASGVLLDKDGDPNLENRSVSTPDSNALVHPTFKMGVTSMQVRVVLDADGTTLGETTLTIPISGVPPPEPPPEPPPPEPPPPGPPIGELPWGWIALGLGAVLLLTGKKSPETPKKPSKSPPAAKPQ